MKKDCPLCDQESFRFYITLCRSHKRTPLIVSVEHKQDFSQKEKDMILAMFPDRHVRFRQRTIEDHAHCHLEWPKDDPRHGMASDTRN
ncbi:MAG: hypothetical protein QGG53_24105, partial [Planctomycetota bacterium]|nr:hypothetical protein [Planctomycetota bacterium]